MLSTLSRVCIGAVFVASAGFLVTGESAGRAAQRGVADLAVTMRAADGVAGTAMQFTATVVNDGPQGATDVVIVFAVPTGPGQPLFGFGVTNRPKPHDKCFWGNPPVSRVLCPIGDLDGGQSASATYSIVPAVGGTLQSSATGSGSSDDPNPDNNTASIVVKISDRVVPHPRAITFALAATRPHRLRAMGSVTASDGFRPCVDRTTVWVQRFVPRKARWRTVLSGQTGIGGRYRLFLARHRGRYRAVAVASSVAANVCSLAISPTVAPSGR